MADVGSVGGRVWLLVGNRDDVDMLELGSELGFGITALTDGSFRVTTNTGPGRLEWVTGRVLAWYDANKHPSNAAKLASHPALDRAWLCGSALAALWDWAARSTEPDGTTRIVCRQRDGAGAEAKLELRDSVRVLRGRLARLQQACPALEVISELRVPAGEGHIDVASRGRLTGHGCSATELTHGVRMLGCWYDAMLRMLQTGCGQQLRIEYRNRLSAESLSRLVSMQFGRRESEFGLWGRPIPLKEGHVHVYGRDRKGWGQVAVDLHRGGLSLFVSDQTSVNVICRVVAAVQSGLDPTSSVYYGQSPYVTMWRDALRGVTNDGPAC